MKGARRRTDNEGRRGRVRRAWQGERWQEKVEEGNEFKYLGSVMCKHGGTERETRERALQGRKVVGSLGIECEKECKIILNGEAMEEVNEFKYLGSVMCKHGGTEGETRERALQGRMGVGSLVFRLNILVRG